MILLMLHHKETDINQNNNEHHGEAYTLTHCIQIYHQNLLVFVHDNHILKKEQN